MQCYITPLLHLELTQVFCSFILFPSTPLIVFFVAMKICAIPLSEPLVDHRPRSEIVRSCVGGPRGYHHILADINNDIVWMVPTRLLISKSFSPCTNPLVTVPSAPITIGITIIIIIIIIIIVIILLLVYLSQASVSGLSFEPKWQQISLSLQDFSQYSGRSRLCCSLDSLDSSSNFSNLLVLFRILKGPLQAFQLIAINVTLMFHNVFSSMAKSEYLSIFSFSVIFTAGKVKSVRRQVLSFLLINTRFILLIGIMWSVCISKSQRIFSDLADT